MTPPTPQDPCPFCLLSSQNPPPPPSAPFTPHPSTPHVLHATDSAIAVLDILPLAKGHTLLIPRRHAEKVFDLGEGEVAGVMALGRTVWRAIDGVLRSSASSGTGSGDASSSSSSPTSSSALDAGGEDGQLDYNLVVNNGVRAGQVVPHVHLHVVPRREDLGVGVGESRAWRMFGKGVRGELDEGGEEVREFMVRVRGEIERAEGRARL